MPTFARDITFQATVVASAAVAAPLSALAAMRKCAPTFAGGNVPGHFLKHVDEQTIVALESLRLALADSGLDPAEHTDWGVVTAGRFVGRIVAANIVNRFARGGGTAVPTHAAAQYSLNSAAGAASIVLASHGPSVGVGGGPGALGDGLLAAVTLFETTSVPGVWLLATQWEPEPVPDKAGQTEIDTTCHAVALALVPGGSGRSILELSLPVERVAINRTSIAEPTVSQLASSVRQAASGVPITWSCQLPGGGTVNLHLDTAAEQYRAAA